MYIIFHTCELHEVDDVVVHCHTHYYQTVYSLEVFTSSFNMPQNTYYMSKSKQPTTHPYGLLSFMSKSHG